LLLDAYAQAAYSATGLTFAPESLSGVGAAMNHQVQVEPTVKVKPSDKQAIAWFESISRADVASVGGKGANLGEMARAGLPVPPGFVITARAFVSVLEAAGIREVMAEQFAATDADDAAALSNTSKQLQKLLMDARLPSALQTEIVQAYKRLGASEPVAVRSSATSEDTASTSFAGMHESYTHVVGAPALIEKVKSCWASAYGQRVLAYRKAQKMTEEPQLAVVVQKMVNSARSGVMFTADPASGDRSRLLIEAAFRSEERRVGKECRRLCRSRWSPYH
jgi:pyruvate,water dikinase